MKKRYKKAYALNKKYAKKLHGEINCIVCGLGYDLRKLKKWTRNSEAE